MKESELFEILADKISCNYNPNEWGDCNYINATIAKFLEYKGFKVKCVSGYVKCDNPTTCDWIYDPKHFWIIYNDKILDFSSRQFKNSFYDNDLNSQMSQSYFYGICYNYIKIAEHNINNEWVRDEYHRWTDPSNEDYIK